jgi:O-antigen/teichoic acid export membrane protein
MRHVSSKPENFSLYWGNILLATASAGSVITVILYLIAPHLLDPASASVTLLVALGECVCRQLVICIGQLFQAFERLQLTAAMNLLTSSLRLAAVVVLSAVVQHGTAWQWALASLFVSVLAAVAGAMLVILRFGGPTFSIAVFWSRLAEGLNFSLAGSSQTIYNDVDKTMLSHYGMNIANGIYTMAYRVVDVATIPIMALDAAALPRYMRQSSQGVSMVKHLSVRLAGRAALIGLLMTACMFVAAPFIPLIIGGGFKESVMALRWLCLLPAFRGVHQLTGGAVTGMGFQRYRTWAQMAAAALNFGLNLWLIPSHGWRGAAWASLATDGTLAVVNWLLLQNLRNQPLETQAALS